MEKKKLVEKLRTKCTELKGDYAEKKNLSFYVKLIYASYQTAFIFHLILAEVNRY